MESVNIIPLRSTDGEDERDIFIKASIVTTPTPTPTPTPTATIAHPSFNPLTSDDFTWDLRATDGDEIRRLTLRSKEEIANSRKKNCKLSDDEWVILVHQFFLNRMDKEDDWNNYEVLGHEREGGKIWEIEISITSHGLRSLLGSFKLSNPSQSVDEEYDPFQWSMILQKTRNCALQENKSLKKELAILKYQNERMLKEQTDFYESLQAKQIHQLKVFSKVLNDQQQRYRDLLKLTNFEDPCDEVININYIKNIDQDIKFEEAKQPKEKKAKKDNDPVKKEPKRPKPRVKKEQKPKPSLIRKTPNTSPKKPKPSPMVQTSVLPTPQQPSNVSIIRGINHIKSDDSRTTSMHFQFTNHRDTTETLVKGPLGNPKDLIGVQEPTDYKAEEAKDGDTTREDADQLGDVETDEGEEIDDAEITRSDGDEEIVTDNDEEIDQEKENEEENQETDQEMELRDSIPFSEIDDDDIMASDDEPNTPKKPIQSLPSSSSYEIKKEPISQEIIPKTPTQRSYDPQNVDMEELPTDDDEEVEDSDISE